MIPINCGNAFLTTRIGEIFKHVLPFLAVLAFSLANTRDNPPLLDDSHRQCIIETVLDSNR
jgi:hypothetical protein